MKRRRLIVTAAAVALLAPLPAEAAGAPPQPVGRPCAFLIAENVTVADGVVGQVNGGPLVVPGYDVSMRCSVKVDGWSHSAPAAAAAATAPTPNATVLAPTPIWYSSGTYTYLCTEATAGGTTWYWTNGAWSTTPTSTCVPSCDFYDECLLRLVEDLHELGAPLPEPVRDLVWDPVFDWFGCWWWGWYCPLVEQPVCAAFQYARPGVPGVVEIREDGDVYVSGEWFWDCPPYGPYEDR